MDPAQVGVRFATSFGAIWILAVIGFRRAPTFVRASAIMLPALALNFFIASDWDRVLTVAFPIVIVLACRVRLRWPALIAFLVVQALLSGLALNRLTGYYHEDLSHPHTSLTLGLLVLALIIVIVGAVARHSRASNTRRSSFSSASA